MLQILASAVFEHSKNTEFMMVKFIYKISSLKGVKTKKVKFESVEKFFFAKNYIIHGENQ